MGLFSRRKPLPELSGMNLDQLLYEADVQQDPKGVYQALLKAEALAPDSLEVQRRLLLHGRLHERSARAMDPTVISCYAFHAFEHPEAHSAQEQQGLIRGLFDSPRLQRCLQLSPEPAAFLQEVLLELARRYMRIFVAPDTSHAPRVFGLSFKSSLHRYLAVPARDILTNILSSPHLSKEEARLLAQAFYRAFYEDAQGDSQALDSLLGAEVCAQLR